VTSSLWGPRHLGVDLFTRLTEAQVMTADWRIWLSHVCALGAGHEPLDQCSARLVFDGEMRCQAIRVTSRRFSLILYRS
jgi:hypothetical protein